MPRSKRNKQVELAKTKKRGLEWKKKLFEEVRSCVDSYANVFVFSVSDMRNNKMKNVREQWKHSRFFIGKNKIMAMALGRFAEEEYRPNLHKLGQQIRGQRGLLFSNKSVEEVIDWFRSYSEGDYARSGNKATQNVTIGPGPIPMFPHNQEPYLRQLGLPTTLQKGVIHLTQEFEVCKEGSVLTPESAKILKLFGYEMAEFQVTIDCVWSQDGSFVQFTESVHTGIKESKKNKKKSSLGSKPSKTTETENTENMEVEEEEEEESSDDSEGEVLEGDLKVKSPLNGEDFDSTKLTTGTPKEKTEDKKSSLLEETEEPIVDNKLTMNGDDTENNAADSSSKKVRPYLGVKTPKSVKAKSKKEVVMKTPDADTSQDSPVFRELRNRSVKFSRKKK